MPIRGDLKLNYLQKFIARACLKCPKFLGDMWLTFVACLPGFLGDIFGYFMLVLANYVASYEAQLPRNRIISLRMMVTETREKVREIAEYFGPRFDPHLLPAPDKVSCAEDLNGLRLALGKFERLKQIEGWLEFFEDAKNQAEAKGARPSVFVSGNLTIMRGERKKLEKELRLSG